MFQGLSDPLEQLRLMAGSSDLREVDFTSHRRLLGPAVVKIKRQLRLFLDPLLTRQSEFNQANVRLLSAVFEQLHRLSTERAALRWAQDDNRDELRAEIAALRDELRRVQQENHDSVDQLEASFGEAVGRLEAALRNRA